MEKIVLGHFHSHALSSYDRVEYAFLFFSELFFIISSPPPKKKKRHDLSPRVKGQGGLETTSTVSGRSLYTTYFLARTHA